MPPPLPRTGRNVEGRVAANIPRPQPNEWVLRCCCPSQLLPAGVAAIALLVPAAPLPWPVGSAAAEEGAPLWVVAVVVTLHRAVIGGGRLICMPPGRTRIAKGPDARGEAAARRGSTAGWEAGWGLECGPGRGGLRSNVHISWSLPLAGPLRMPCTLHHPPAMAAPQPGHPPHSRPEHLTPPQAHQGSRGRRSPRHWSPRCRPRCPLHPTVR